MNAGALAALLGHERPETAAATWAAIATGRPGNVFGPATPPLRSIGSAHGEVATGM